MSLECAECERDLRGGHADNCSRHPKNRTRAADAPEGMDEHHISVDREVAPTTASEVAKYLREMACVDPETGRRRLPTDLDDNVFNAAALYIERQEAFMDHILDRILADDRPFTDRDLENVRQFDAIIKAAEEKRLAFNAGWNLAGGDHTQQEAFSVYSRQRDSTN